ncbi:MULTISPECIES: hypothetical protein [Acinetobacter]|uniref:hypothetical protein n=1 Tax=Acinetobacter TaxID=469 RepID=UPI001CE446BF|nr:MULTISPECIES: hypothetical protein [Acinetobacter]MCH7338197.1 hypothetical protein [Acinetobacter higginsii]
MNVFEILKKNIKNVPLGATDYNFHRGCFTKDVGVLKYYYYEPANSWRIFTGIYDKTYSMRLIPFDIFNLISMGSITPSEAHEELIRNEIKMQNNKRDYMKCVPTTNQ